MKPSEVLRQAVAVLEPLFFESSAINLKQHLEKQFLGASYSEIKSFELADEWLQRFIELVNGSLEEWRRIAVPVPAILDVTLAVAYCAGHPRYALEVREALSPDFKLFLEFLPGLSPREMLACTAIVAYAMGCDPILISDSPNDEGVDVVGRVSCGPFAGTVVFAQSKSASSSVAKATVMLDYTKYVEGTTKVAEYMEAVGASASGSGSSRMYLFCTNNDFDDAAIDYARGKGILLRCGRQVVKLVMDVVQKPDDFKPLLNALIGTLRRDLSSNFGTTLVRAIEEIQAS